MASNTTGRYYDIGTMLDNFRRRIEVLERAIRALAFILPNPGTVYDTGWVSVPAAAGFTSALQVRRIGHHVTSRGTLSPAVDWGAANSLQQAVAAGGIPAEFRSPVSLTILGATGATTAATIFRVAIQSNGGVQVRCSTAAHTNSCSVNLTYIDS